MLNSYMQRIKNCINFTNNFFAEDKEAQRKDYYEKLEKVLELTIKLIKKYDILKTHTFSFYNYSSYLYIFLLIGNDGEAKWQINSNDKVKSFEESITTEELVNYCWEKKVNIESFMTNLFSYFSQMLEKKEKIIKEKKNKYIKEISYLNEAIKNLQELIETDISEEIRNK